MIGLLPGAGRHRSPARPCRSTAAPIAVLAALACVVLGVARAAPARAGAWRAARGDRERRTAPAPALLLVLVLGDGRVAASTRTRRRCCCPALHLWLLARRARGRAAARAWRLVALVGAAPVRCSSRSTTRAQFGLGPARAARGTRVLLVAGGDVGPGSALLVWSLAARLRRCARDRRVRWRRVPQDAGRPAAATRGPLQLRRPGLAGRNRVGAAAMSSPVRAAGAHSAACRTIWTMRGLRVLDRPDRGGLLLLADAGLTLAWQEPVSALYAQVTPGRSLGGDLEELEDPARAPPSSARSSSCQTSSAAAALPRPLAQAPSRRRARRSAASRSRDRRDYVVVEGTDRATCARAPASTRHAAARRPGTSAIAGHRTTYGAPFRDIDELEQRRHDHRRDAVRRVHLRGRAHSGSSSPTRLWVTRASATTGSCSPPATRSTAPRSASSSSRGSSRASRAALPRLKRRWTLPDRSSPSRRGRPAPSRRSARGSRCGSASLDTAASEGGSA